VIKDTTIEAPNPAKGHIRRFQVVHQEGSLALKAVSPAPKQSEPSS